MRRLSAASRITIGLVCSMLGILLGANMLGLLPDRYAQMIRERTRLAEAVSLSSSMLLSGDDTRQLQQYVNVVSTTSPGLLSLGIRRSDGAVLAASEDHKERWPDGQTENTEQFLQVTVADRGGRRAAVEFVFAPVAGSGVASVLESSLIQLLIFAGIMGFIGFRIYLKTVLKNLDPSRAVPRRVREALDILTEGLMIVGRDDRILLANSALAEAVGLSAEALIGRKAGELGLSVPEGSRQYPWQHSLSTRQPVSGVITELKKGNQTHTLKINCSPLLGDDSTLRGVMVSLDDVTQLEQNKRDLQIAKDEADAANKAKSDFLANMSHEIRNPMNAIVGFAEILRMGLSDSEEARLNYLNTIHASGTHLVELINDILDFSKIEAGRLELEIRPCNPFQLMQEVISVLSGKAEEQGIKLVLELNGEIPRTIRTDATRLRQILMNLVSNAIKFTSEGEVRVVAELVDSGPAALLQFAVSDTGIGITQEQISRLFQEFMQADNSVTRRFGGTGLGLAISKRLTEALGGTIHVTSEYGRGSTFSFSIQPGDLTGVERADLRTLQEHYRSQALSRQTGLTTWFKPARVLVTDDGASNRQLVKVVLSKAGLIVDEAENGAIAVEKATKEQYDLILMDVQMPVMDGFTAMETLRRAGLTIPIISFTANVMEQDRQRCIDAGCSGFLTKPINIEKLLETIAQWLPTAEAPPEPVAESAEHDPIESVIRAITAKSVQRTSLGNGDSSADTDCSSEGGAGQQKPKARVVERTPLISQLPWDVPEFREIIEQFVVSLETTLPAMQAAWDDRDYSTLREQAHRLKGTGGTVGFPAFTEPSRLLQIAAEKENPEPIPEILDELRAIADAIQLPQDNVTG
ncbi:MAG: response regulator [Planctomycetaceae bacterium]|nr:response regulator [Planctomycetaceae bacterium]